MSSSSCLAMALRAVEMARDLLKDAKTEEERRLLSALDAACNLVDVGPTKQQWRVTARPPKGREGHNWQLRYFPPPGEGRPGKEGTEYQRSAKTRDEGEAWALARQREAELNGTCLSLGDAMFAHLAHAEEKSGKPNTLSAMRVAANRVSGKVGIPTEASVALWQDALEVEGLAGKTINGYLRWGHMAWKWAKKRGLVDRPWPDVDPLPEKKTDLRPCTPRETLNLLEHFDARSGRFEWEGPYFALLAAAGSRVTETMRLRHEDLDRELGRVRFRSEETKTDAWRIAVVPPEVLKRIPEGEGEIWPSLRYWDVRRAWKRALKACRLEAERIRPHSMRRAWISDQFEAGTPLPHIMEQVGHTSPKTTLGYQQNATERDLERSCRRLVEFRERTTHSSPTALWEHPVESGLTQGGVTEVNREVYCSIEGDPMAETQARQGIPTDLPPGVSPTVGVALVRALEASPALRTWLLDRLTQL